jgi:hypothetical protein
VKRKYIASLAPGDVLVAHHAIESDVQVVVAHRVELVSDKSLKGSASKLHGLIVGRTAFAIPGREDLEQGCTRVRPIVPTAGQVRTRRMPIKCIV